MDSRHRPGDLVPRGRRRATPGSTGRCSRRCSPRGSTAARRARRARRCSSNVRFYPSAAAAVAAGFRACRRCRPDALPGSRAWDHRGDLVARALRLIAAGEVDEHGVRGLAARLNVSERHLHRSLVAEVGVGSAGAGQDQARPDRPPPRRPDRAGDDRDRVRGRVRQRPAVQRRDAQRVRLRAVRAAPRARTGAGVGGQPGDRRPGAAAGAPRAVPGGRAPGVPGRARSVAGVEEPVPGGAAPRGRRPGTVPPWSR